MTIEIATLLERASDLTGEIIAAVGDDQWHQPTPCSRYDVERLLRHMIGAVPERPIDPDEEELDLRAPSPAAVYTAAVADARRAWADPARLEEVYAFSWGEMSGRTAAEWMLIEGVVHGWDLATATGQAFEPDPDLVAASLELVQHLDEGVLRADGMFGAAVEVPEDAPALDRLVGLLGRDPAAGTANC